MKEWYIITAQKTNIKSSLHPGDGHVPDVPVRVLVREQDLLLDGHRQPQQPGPLLKGEVVGSLVANDQELGVMPDGVSGISQEVHPKLFSPRQKKSPLMKVIVDLVPQYLDGRLLCKIIMMTLFSDRFFYGYLAGMDCERCGFVPPSDP